MVILSLVQEKFDAVSVTAHDVLTVRNASPCEIGRSGRLQDAQSKKLKLLSASARNASERHWNRACTHDLCPILNLCESLLKLWSDVGRPSCRLMLCILCNMRE